MELSDSTLIVLLGIAITAAVVAAALAAVAIVGQRRVRAAFRVFAGPRGIREDVVEIIERHVIEVRGLREDVDEVRRYSQDLRRLVGDCVSRTATVRYDAFDDMGGRMSFSSALLDEHGNGIVLTSINGRVETRTYAKPVRDGDSPHNLSDEEAEAIRRALTNHRGDEEITRRRAPRGVSGPAAGARVIRSAS